MLGDVAVLVALMAACFSLGLFAGLGIAISRRSALELRIGAVEELLKQLEDDGQDEEPLPNKAASLANIAEHYGCTVVRSPSGEAYATFGTGHC